MDEVIYYHVAAGLYSKGNQILPGNWGRLVVGIGPNHPLYFREFAFEQVRRSEFSDRVSRLEAAFAFESIDVAHAYRAEIDPNAVSHYVYAVKIDPSARHDSLDITWLTVIREYRTYEGVHGAIQAYWRGDRRGPTGQEVLTSGPLTVVDRLTPIPDNGWHSE